jgi:hypothetical protein
VYAAGFTRRREWAPDGLSVDFFGNATHAIALCGAAKHGHWILIACKYCNFYRSKKIIVD